MNNYMTLGIAKQVTVKLRWGTVMLNEYKLLGEFMKNRYRGLYNVRIAGNGEYMVFNLKEEKLQKYDTELIKEYYDKFLIHDDKIIANIDKIKDYDVAKRKKLKEEYYSYSRVGINERTVETIFENVKPYVTEFIAFYEFKDEKEKESIMKKIEKAVNENIKEENLKKQDVELLIRSSKNPLRSALMII